MDTSKLKKFAQSARQLLMEQVRSKLDRVLAEGSRARRESSKAVAELEKQVEQSTRERVIERIAYTWFNRFCALRFMDANGYTRIGTVSPAEGFSQPEILMDAKQGVIDVAWKVDRPKVVGLLDGSAPSDNPEQEAYQLLLVGVCNSYQPAMPFMFEKIADYTELLIPDDLLSESSILTMTRQALTPENCKDVEVIGWLYQFYISEKKDDVFAALKKGKKITPENIPAATQLFTPHWIVRYLVENSLGRLWMLNHPDSRLIERMEYYIRPEEPETDFLRIRSPEEIKICDPACGSGHMLTYAFDLLYTIYEEQGYQATDIPRLILTHNLYGIEIDQRAGALAAFALTMKAREKYRRFLTQDNVVQPNICVLENIHIDAEDLSAYMDKVGRDLFAASLQEVVNQWEEADNFGSLIRPAVTDVSDVLDLLRERQMNQDLFLADVHQKVLKALRQADYLSPKYHVVVANPPYMGGGGMNASLKDWAKKEYPRSKIDLFAMFMERTLEMTSRLGFVGMINLPSWLFLTAFAPLRKEITDNYRISSLLHMGRGIFGIDWGSVAFVICNVLSPDKPAAFFRLHDRNFQHVHFDDIRQLFLNVNKNHDYRYDFGDYRDTEGINDIPNESNPLGIRMYYESSTGDFRRMPETAIAYWAGERVLTLFDALPSLSDVIETREGLTTGDNERFLRYWFEVSNDARAIGSSENHGDDRKWFNYVKGGDYRKWAGNYEHVVNWENDGHEIRNNTDKSTGRVRSHNYNGDYAFREGFTWSGISSGSFGIRDVPRGFMFDTKGPMGFAKQPRLLLRIEALLNSSVSQHIIKMLAPTLDFKLGHVLNLPFAENISDKVDQVAAACIEIGVADWNSFETSWDFVNNLLLCEAGSSIRDAYSKLRKQWADTLSRLEGLERENNDLMIEAYGLQGVVSRNVDSRELTIFTNPRYRYDDDKSELELEAILLADTMREFISYAVGCMFGRYSLDKPGLILASQGETTDEYRQQIPEPTFAPDEDNVIPLLDGDWFTDEISERFKQFLRVTFGTEHYEENLTFLENALYPENAKGKKRKTIRDYFLKEFYDHHVKLYKKRPIYWLFSSAKGSFNALIYMHRYRPDTLSVVLNDYLREFITKLRAKTEHLQAIADSGTSSQEDKANALKEIANLRKILKELEDYDRNVLFPLAQQKIEIDLDDGVKVNYNKFGKALKKVVGLSE